MGARSGVPEQEELKKMKHFCSSCIAKGKMKDDASVTPTSIDKTSCEKGNDRKYVVQQHIVASGGDSALHCKRNCGLMEFLWAGERVRAGFWENYEMLDGLC